MIHKVVTRNFRIARPDGKIIVIRSSKVSGNGAACKKCVLKNAFCEHFCRSDERFVRNYSPNLNTLCQIPWKEIEWHPNYVQTYKNKEKNEH
jgi:hypothetical protein